MFTSHHTVKMHRGAFSDINSTSLGYVHLRHGDDDGDEDDDNDDYEDLYSLFTSGTTMMRMMMMMIREAITGEK